MLEKASKISLLQERLELMNDRDKEFDRIFDYIYDLTRINVQYCAIPGDKIDRQLAGIINDNERSSDSVINKAKMLFVREAEGVYTYCKKKVFMKNEQDRLIIRVGGGYMSLEEFIDTFNPFQSWKPRGSKEESGANKVANPLSSSNGKQGSLNRSLSNCKLQSRSSPRLGIAHLNASKKVSSNNF